MDFTFGIVAYESDTRLVEIIKSIESQNIPHYEIIIVGNSNIKGANITVIPFNETVKPKWITRKKNIITEKALYENIVYLHDYVKFEEGWYRGQLKAGNDFQIRVDRTLNFDGKRAGDWLLCMWDDPIIHHLVCEDLSCLLPYDIRNLSKHMYISGVYWIAKKEIMEKYPLDETKVWGESEDVEWSRRVREDYEFNLNLHSTIRFMKQKEMPFKEPTRATLEILNRITKQNKFTIMTPSYNNSEWVEYNLASVLNQTYTNWRLLYIDDCSTDDTYEKVSEILKDNSQCKVVQNKENKGATYNYLEYTKVLFPDDDEIIVHLDGDDWLYDENVLEKLNALYNEKDYWMTYGKFVCYDGSGGVTESFPQGSSYDDFVHRHKMYRRDQWRASHLRTYKYFLWNSIDREDLKSRFDSKYFWHASDLAWAYPALEMCPKDKIGVVNFETHVYNATPKNQTRTREREAVDNSKFEIEIRNKKTYKEGLRNGKLPQVNVFNQDYYLEYNNIPTKFTYCYQQTDGEFDMTILCDPAILEYLEGKIQIDRKVPLVARLFEQRDYFQRRIYNAILANHDKFDAILTFDRELLKLVPNAIFLPPTEVTQFNRLPNPYGHEPYKSPLISTFELPDSALQMYPKSKLVSAVVSTKAFLPGHVKRLAFIRAIADKIDLFGRGIKEIPSKLDGLRDYMFSVAIENVSCDDNYFSEKIMDCFLTGTIPIYHGCIHIGEFFDERGILSFETQEELDAIIASLTPEKYYSMLEYAKKNYEACYKWPLNNDMLYDMYLKKVIEDGITF